MQYLPKIQTAHSNPIPIHRPINQTFNDGKILSKRKRNESQIILDMKNGSVRYFEGDQEIHVEDDLND